MLKGSDLLAAALENEGVAPRVRAAMLDHVTLRTHDLEGTRVFFEKVLDLKPGYRPDFPLAGHWLYADGEPIVHLVPGGGGPVDRRGETIDHVGFRLNDYDGHRRKLDALGVAYSTMKLPELGERRLVCPDPHRHPARAGVSREDRRLQQRREQSKCVNGSPAPQSR
jgi:catechol 2,3-dioxygenase-like lactoylglutathione lyase family enzyme